MSAESFPRLILDDRFKGLVVLREFDEDLTHLHGRMTCSIPISGKSLFEVIGFTNTLLASIAPRFRLHGNNVCLMRPDRLGTGVDIQCLQQWIQSHGFDIAEPCQCYLATAESPFEDGFFNCLCLRTDDAHPPRGERSPTWQVLAAGSRSATDTLVDFVEKEITRCEKLLMSRYELPHGRCFDAENADLEFAASVISPIDFRIWSRTVSYPD
ncbi:MAG: hypothetical protein J5I93_02180 [Pirellulaceae bacterium]|nr:hypothetical protein [Pirellulaceae bacterium]